MLGFTLRTAFLAKTSPTALPTQLDINILAASTVFITAGMSACTCGQAGVLGDWCVPRVGAGAAAAHRLRGCCALAPRCSAATSGCNRHALFVKTPSIT